MTRGQGDTKRLTQVAARDGPARGEQAALGLTAHTVSCGR